jgi:hypothetical protein
VKVRSYECEFRRCLELSVFSSTSFSVTRSVAAISHRERVMRAYVMVTGTIFALLTLAHIWRVIEEGSHLATDPWYVLITLAAAALSLWAWRLLWRLPRR